MKSRSSVISDSECDVLGRSASFIIEEALFSCPPARKEVQAVILIAGMLHDFSFDAAVFLGNWSRIHRDFPY